jgi:hypothetical protein
MYDITAEIAVLRDNPLGEIFSSYFDVPLSVSFHQSSILVFHPSSTDPNSEISANESIFK